jgi:hypothetical protein
MTFSKTYYWYVVKTGTALIGIISLILAFYAYLIPPQPGDYRIACIVLTGGFSIWLLMNATVDFAYHKFNWSH